MPLERVVLVALGLLNSTRIDQDQLSVALSYLIRRRRHNFIDTFSRGSLSKSESKNNREVLEKPAVTTHLKLCL